MKLLKQTKKKSGQGVSENYKYGWIYWDRLEFLIPVIRAGKGKDWHKTCFDKTCFKMFYAVWPLCKTSTCFNLKHVKACFTVKHLPFGQAFKGFASPWRHFPASHEHLLHLSFWVSINMFRRWTNAFSITHQLHLLYACLFYIESNGCMSTDFLVLRQTESLQPLYLKSI